MAGQSIAQAPIATPTLQQATGKSISSARASQSYGAAGQKPTDQVVNTSTIIAADGSTTTVTNYANGARSTTTVPAAKPAAVPQLLAAGTGGNQLRTLLAAQEQAYAPG